MTALKWFIICSFAGSVLAAILSYVFRISTHAIGFPQPHLFAAAVVLIAVALLSSLIWLLVKLFKLR